MIQGFYSGVSGIKTYQTAIDVTSNNIANINTVGFRGNTTEFASLFEDTLSMTHANTVHNYETVGVGTRVDTIAMTKDQGSISLTDRSTDLAISGDGWFSVQSNSEDIPLYTRAGDFTFDADSNLVTPDGYHVLGTMGSNIENGVVIKRKDGREETVGKITQQLAEVPLAGVEEQVPLSFPKYLYYPAEPTSEVKLIGNIGTTDEKRTMGASVIDKDGIRNQLTITYTKAPEQTPPGSQWNAVATITSRDGKEIYAKEEGVIEFNEDGSLSKSPFETIDHNGTPVKIDLGTKYDGVVSIANSDITASNIVNGKIAGDLQGYEINKNAEVIAVFTNGVQTSVGKIAVYHFQNDQGLGRITGTKFRETTNSGKALFFQDANGKNVIGTNIANYQLENSNVKTEVGLTDLIIYQRAFDANSKCITTADQMMQKALQMDA